MTAPARTFLILLLAASAAYAGPRHQPPPPRQPQQPPCPVLAPVVYWFQRVVDHTRACLATLFPPESVPYLQATPPTPFRLAGTTELQRQPPRLPTIEFTEPKTAAPAPATSPLQGTDDAIPGIDPNAAPEPAALPAPTPEEEAVKFFEREPKEARPAPDRPAYSPFDPTFQPGLPAASESRATYQKIP